MSSFRVRQINRTLVFAVIFISAIAWLQPVLGQAMKNPVLEFCTGTWCQWCPCGHTVIHHDVLPQIPNAIILAYHGPANYAGEPFSFFNGNSILGSLGYSAYPSGVVDRVSGIIYRDRWQAEMNARANWPTMVTIDMVKKGYNPFTRQFHATINFTPKIDLNGEYKFNLILV